MPHRKSRAKNYVFKSSKIKFSDRHDYLKLEWTQFRDNDRLEQIIKPTACLYEFD
jgi:hypothetical protein